MPKLRVALVAPSLGILGGQSVQADRLLQKWADDPDVDAWLVPVNPLPAAPLRFLTQIKYARTIVTELAYWPLLVKQLARANVVHVFSASYASFLLAPLPAIIAARLLGRPVLLNYRSGEAPDHLRRSTIARAAIARVDANIVPSQFLVDVFGEFGIRASAISNLVERSSFPFRVREPLQPKLLSTRNFDGLYNVACTLRAFRLIQDAYPEASLVLVGAGPEEPRLRALAADLSLERVTFAGRVPPDRIAAFYSNADVYIQSPNIDNMPTSVLEAFASGCPVVSTEAGGIPSMVKHGSNGLLASLDDHVALAAHVLSLLRDPERARAIAIAASASTERCTWPVLRQQWLRAYRSLAAEYAVGGAEPSVSAR